MSDNTNDQHKIDILSLVAHQLKTPLGSIRWNLEGLLEGDYAKKDPATYSVIKEVYSANGRLIDLVDDLINASRIDHQKVSWQPVTVTVDEIIESILKELHFQILNRELKIENRLTYKLPILIDKKRLREVVQNLITNAIKYNRIGGVVTIEDKLTDNNLEIGVSDTGIGIPDDDLPSIFSRSFRAKNAMESEIDGSGLGLFVAKSFVEDWGGTIKCQSTMGSGTKFAFTIPLTPKEGQLHRGLDNL